MISSEYPNTFCNPRKFETSGINAPIAFDLDGVLNESGKKLRSGVANFFGKRVDQIINRDPVHGYEKFHFTIPGPTDGEIRAAVNHVIKRDSFQYKSSPHMREVLTWLYKETNMPITVVTARHPDNMEVTYKWLKYRLGNVPFRLIMVNGMQKEVVLTRINTRIFIDDRYKTVKTLENHIMYPVLYSRPWNQGRPEPAGAATILNLGGVVPLLYLLEEYFNVGL